MDISLYDEAGCLPCITFNTKKPSSDPLWLFPSPSLEEVGWSSVSEVP